jgi:hypothetical protein
MMWTGGFHQHQHLHQQLQLNLNLHRSPHAPPYPHPCLRAPEMGCAQRMLPLGDACGPSAAETLPRHQLLTSPTAAVTLPPGSHEGKEEPSP